MKRNSSADTAEKVQAAIMSSLKQLDKTKPGEFGPAVQNGPVIVFNSRMAQALITKSATEKVSFKEIGRKQPRVFHKLLGQYIGDLQAKDRLYRMGLNSMSVDGVMLEIWVLTPEIPVQRFLKRAPLLQKMLRRRGRVSLFCRMNYTDYLEATLNRFGGNHPHNFPKTRYLSSLWVNEKAPMGRRHKGSFLFFDSFFVGNGYAVQPNADPRKFVHCMSEYVGPFLIFGIRARRQRAEEYALVAKECIKELLADQSCA